VTASPDNPPEGDQLRAVLVGSVDHGKSTLIGRLLHDIGALPEGRVEELERTSRRRGVPLEWSFVLDSFQAERDQAVTIDTTRIWVRTPRREIVFIDAPGHREFIRNMLTASSSADVGVLVVDASSGIEEQSLRHSILLRLVGISEAIVAVNKMDLVRYSSEAFARVRAAVEALFSKLGVRLCAVVPVAAREGVNLAHPANALMPWYSGPTILSALEQHRADRQADSGLRLLVQDVYRQDGQRIIVGKIAAGTLDVGQEILFSPTNHAARVASIVAWPDRAPRSASAGDAVALTLDSSVFVERGHVASGSDTPPPLTDVMRATLVALSAQPLERDRLFKCRIGTLETTASIRQIHGAIDLDSLELAPASSIGRDRVAEVTLHTRHLVSLGRGDGSDPLSRLILIDGTTVVAAGVARLDGFPDQRRARVTRATNVTEVRHLVSREERARRKGHRGLVVWMTGLSGAGKSTIALGAERALYDHGVDAYVLDGDNLRRGISRDLGFAPEDRTENIRRAGELASILADAGTVAIVALISPFSSDRARARAAAGTDFYEVYVKASLATCEHRDAKGLYRKARAGEIADFTGVSAPYEEPACPDLVLDTEGMDAEQATETLVAFVLERCRTWRGG
jgi:bifunctional enzyme CysN/CysC